MASQEAPSEDEVLLAQTKGAHFEGNAVISKKIADLMTAQRAAKKAREDIRKELRNERRKKQRIMSKAKGLSNTDLVNILAERSVTKSGSSSAAALETGDAQTGKAAGCASASSG